MRALALLALRDTGAPVEDGDYVWVQLLPDSVLDDEPYRQSFEKIARLAHDGPTEPDLRWFSSAELAATADRHTPELLKGSALTGAPTTAALVAHWKKESTS